MWFRRDLRLADHPALAAAAATGPVVPLFVDDPAFAKSGAPRRAHLHDALWALDASMGGALVVRGGEPAAVVVALAREVGAREVMVTRDHAPYGRVRDAAVARALADDGRRLVGVGSAYAATPGEVVKQNGTPYSVFTPFARAWRAHGWDEPVAAPDVVWRGAPEVASDGLPTRPVVDAQLPEAGEPPAWSRWERFARHALARYRTGRDLPAVDGTSRMSVDLRWGVVHPRQLLAELPTTASSEGGAEAFATELAWREFYAAVLLRRPDSAWANLDRRMDAMPVDTDAAARSRLDAWRAGQTGVPIVDAGMRQLLATGWMHNRVRMIAASFLVKDLHLPWQWGARHFMRHLVDGDLASNSHGWQWVAGTGTDAAPYFRVFNPTAQGERFDPDGEYVARWVPERGTDRYPAPIVDHAAERREALRRYELVRAGHV